jgi:uncharacterized Zn-finger protein
MSIPSKYLEEKKKSAENSNISAAKNIKNNFHCEICEKKLSTKGNLDKHLKNHRGERLFKCNHGGCNKSFLDNCRLNSHLIKHVTKN